MSNDLERQADYVAARCGWKSANEMRDCIRRLTQKPAPAVIPFLVPDEVSVIVSDETLAPPTIMTPFGPAVEVSK